MQSGICDPSLPEDAPFEDFNDAFNEIDELLEHWSNRFSIDNLALSERYREFKLKVGLMFTVCVGAEPVTKDYITIFQKLPMGRRLNEKEWHIFDRKHGKGRFKLQPDVGVTGSDRDNCGVFIKDVELVNSPEGFISSFVRLQSLHETSRDRGGSLKVSRELALKNLFGGTYWEIGVLECSGAGGSVVLGKGGSQIIQGGSEVVDDVADETAPVLRNAAVEADAIEFVSRLRMFIDLESIRFSLIEGDECGIKVRKVLLGPIDLYPNADEKVMSHD